MSLDFLNAIPTNLELLPTRLAAGESYDCLQGDNSKQGKRADTVPLMLLRTITGTGACTQAFLLPVTRPCSDSKTVTGEQLMGFKKLIFCSKQIHSYKEPQHTFASSLGTFSLSSPSSTSSLSSSRSEPGFPAGTFIRRG